MFISLYPYSFTMFATGILRVKIFKTKEREMLGISVISIFVYHHNSLYSRISVIK